MSYLTVLTLLLLGILALAIRHIVWRGMVNIARKTFVTVVGPKYDNGERKKLTYGDTKYKNFRDFEPFSKIGFCVACGIYEYSELPRKMAGVANLVDCITKNCNYPYY